MTEIVAALIVSPAVLAILWLTRIPLTAMLEAWALDVTTAAERRARAGLDHQLDVLGTDQDTRDALASAAAVGMPAQLILEHARAWARGDVEIEP